MRDKTITFFQKAVAVLLACLMLLCFLPVGLVPDRDASVKPGEVMAISPATEKYSAKIGKDDEKAEISNSRWAYYRFELASLAEWDIDQIHSVRLTIAFLKGSGTKDNKVEVKLANGAKEAIAEEVVATLNPQTRGADDTLVEVDVTEQIKNHLKNGAEDIGLRILSDENIPIYIATNSFDDPVYRPVLRAVVGSAKQSGSLAAARVTLGEAVYVSEKMPDRKGNDLASESGALFVGGGNETYLRFELNESAIDGVVHRATLSLDKIGETDSTVKIYCINNDEWSGESISYAMRPRGDENTAFSALSAPTRERGRISFDVTQAVCEARNKGIKSLTFRITGGDEQIAFSGKGASNKVPHLYLEASDDADVVRAAEAALRALGPNGAAFVTRKLLDEYEAKNGSASIRWAENSIDGEDLHHQHIAVDGEITRPKWFEGDAEVVAVAQIRSGKYRTERSFSITIPAATAPEYGNYKFDNYIDIGNDDSESEQKVEISSVSGIKRRWINGRKFDYRTIENGGVIVLNLATASDKQNYITLKLWSGDNTEEGDFVIISKDNERINLKTPVKGAGEQGGFVYATYALPTELTRGRSYVTLRLLYEGEASAEPREVYAAYMTDAPFFDPQEFSDRGEKPMGAPLLGEGVTKFINSLRRLAADSDAEGEMSEVLAPSERLKISIDFGLEDIVFTGEVNMAFSIDTELGKAAVYQRLDYYDRYCDACPVMIDGGLVLINYGDYKLAWNKAVEEADLPYSALQMSGVYKELVGGSYYTFLNEREVLDDSVIPEDAEATDGKSVKAAPERILLFKKLSDPMEQPDWRISRINGRSVTEVSLADGMGIYSVTIKGVGGKADGAEEVTVMLALYEGEKIVKLARESVPVIRGEDVYTIDFSKYELYGKSGAVLQVFAFDDTENMTEISPKIEL